MTDPAIPLEILNGCGMIVEAVLLGIMGVYLVREARRRDLTLRDWLLKLPPSMNLAVAMMVFDAGELARTTTIWVWRRFYDAGPFTPGLVISTGLAGYAVLVGALCLIRSVSEPDYGDGPWLLTVAGVLAFLLASLHFH